MFKSVIIRLLKCTRYHVLCIKSSIITNSGLSFFLIREGIGYLFSFLYFILSYILTFTQLHQLTIWCLQSIFKVLLKLYNLNDRMQVVLREINTKPSRITFKITLLFTYILLEIMFIFQKCPVANNAKGHCL